MQDQLISLGFMNDTKSKWLFGFVSLIELYG